MMLAVAPTWGDRLSPEGSALVAVGALIIDTWALGGPRFAPLMDRIAAVGWIAVIAAGFKGSGLTEAVSGTINGFFNMLAGIWSAPLFRGFVHIGPQIIGFLTCALVVGAFAPAKWTLLGHLSKVEFHHLRTAGSAMGRSAFGGGRSGPDMPAVARGGGAGGGGFVVVLRRVFPGSVNLGMVIVAILLVTMASAIDGAFGTACDTIVGWCVNGCADAVAPLLHRMGYQ